MINIKDGDHLIAELQRAEVPALVLFGASWCGPCKTFKPLLEAFTKARGIPMLYVQIDNLRDIAGEYGVRAVPTLVAMKSTVELGRIMGGQTEAALANFCLKNAVGQTKLEF